MEIIRSFPFCSVRDASQINDHHLSLTARTLVEKRDLLVRTSFPSIDQIQLVCAPTSLGVLKRVCSIDIHTDKISQLYSQRYWGNVEETLDCYQITDVNMFPAADPGFPQGDANSPGGANIRFCQIFLKLHEIERIWAPGGTPRAPLNPPLVSVCQHIPTKF